jgi:antirestriction protein
MWQAYIDNCGEADFETARDAFRGKYNSDSDFGMEYAIESGAIDDNHPMFNYIDWEHYAKELLMSGFFENDGYYFWGR